MAGAEELSRARKPTETSNFRGAMRAEARLSISPLGDRRGMGGVGARGKGERGQKRL